jgi:hypothetical protein
MNNKKWQWLLLVVLIVLASFIYPKFMSYWAYLLVPVLKFFVFTMGIKWQMITPIVIILMDFIGAIIIASLLSVSLGYITSVRSVLFGFLLGLGLSLYMLWLHVHCYLYQDAWLTAFIMVVTICEYIGIILAFIIMAKAGALVRSYRERQEFGGQYT